MKTKKLIEVCGSITKKESLIPVDYNILKNTCVAEANEPYSGYYGKRPGPGQIAPNSLFLFTARYYSLKEVLRLAQDLDSHYKDKVNIAPARLTFGHGEYNAIRVKYFPDYENIHLLQDHCIKEGIEFIKKVQVSDSAMVKVDKCFVLEEAEDGIYLDKTEEREAYIAIPKQISISEFSEILIETRNNQDCELFDAVMGAMIIDSKLVEVVRIYAENLNLRLLKCIKGTFARALSD
jgi:hypothetical protein